MARERMLPLLALLIGLTSSCSVTGNQSQFQESGNRQVLSREYCDEATILLDEFDAILFENLYGDKNLSEDLLFGAKRISGLVRRAEFEGVNLRSEEAAWFKKLQDGAKAYVLLAESEEDDFSEEELEEYLGRIDTIFSNARAECVGRHS